MRILVLHGPNLNLLGEREGDEKGRTLADLNALISKRAAELGLEVKILQSNHEGVLVDTLHAERKWAQGIIINPAALTHTSYVLREALDAVGHPTLEVHLTDIRRRESWRRKSVIKDVCEAQVLGKGFDSYLIALQRFAEGDLSGRRRRARTAAKKGTAPASRADEAAARDAAPTPVSSAVLITGTSVPPAHPPRPRPGMGPDPRQELLGAEALGPKPTAARGSEPLREKTLGRAPISERAPAREKSLGRASAPRPKESALSRALVRQKIADRLSGSLTPAGLATWARSQYLEVQRGAPAESGHRELIEDTLQTLVLSTVPASKLSDGELVELMTQLGE